MLQMVRWVSIAPTEGSYSACQSYRNAKYLTGILEKAVFILCRERIVRKRAVLYIITPVTTMVAIAK